MAGGRRSRSRSTTGVVIGAGVLIVLYNSINLLGIPTQLEFAIIGAVILLGVIADEVIRRLVATGRRSNGLQKAPRFLETVVITVRHSKK